MSVPHRSVASAMEHLSTSMLIADDGPFVAFVVGVSPDTAPSAWVCQMDGRHHAMSTMRVGATESVRRPAPWTFADMDQASAWFRDVSSWLRFKGDLAAAIQHANDLWERRRSQAMDRALAADAHAMLNPHACTCGRRFMTERGLAVHARVHDPNRKRPTRRRTPAHGVAARMERATVSAVQCYCGHVEQGTSIVAALRAMDAHIDAAAKP